MQIRVMTPAECSAVLAAGRFAHIACARDGTPYVVPIYLAYADNHLYGFSMPGQKIEWMRANPRASVVMEERGQGREWKSVVVDGRFEELPDRLGHKHERDRAWALLSRHADWWEPGAIRPVSPAVSHHSDHIFFRIHVETLSGREARNNE